MIKAFFYKTDGSVEEHELDENALPMDEIRKFVQGDIEFVSVRFNGKDSHMIVNDIGAIINLPMNNKATDIYHEVVKLRCEERGVPYVKMDYHYIYGNAVVFEGRLP